MNITLRPRRGITLIELMVVIAVIGVLIAVAAPSVRKLLDVQRLRGVSAQLTTDIQFVRTEAATRQEISGISFRSIAGGQSCYTVHTCGSRPAPTCTCDCAAVAGSRCPTATLSDPDTPREIRTVTVPQSQGVQLSPTDASGVPFPVARVLFDPATGSLSSFYPSPVNLPPPPFGDTFIGVAKLVAPAAATGSIRTEINRAGRPRTCAGIAPC